jgi:hypothetical protein
MRTLPLAALTALACLSAPAHAVGVGTSIAFSQDGFWTYAPTLDLIFEPVTLQLHVAETLDQAFDDDLYLGADLVVTVAEVKANDWLRGVFEPGAAVWVNGDPSRFSLAAVARAGAVAGKGARVGLYVVPYLGMTIDDGDVSLFASGGAQVAVSFDL